MTPDGAYRASRITKSFAGVAVLHGVDFAVRPGTIHGLFGHNGAGKSTLLKILAGAQPQDDGTLSIGGRAIRLASPRDALDQGIACVYQELRLISNLTVAENLFLGRELRRNSLKDSAGMIAYAQTLLDGYGMRISAAARVATLSHPEKQMVEVIANLDRKARFLFLDEPTTALDGGQAASLLAAIRRIALERQIGVVLVSHKLDEVLGVCDEATVLSGGRTILHVEREQLKKQAIVDAIVGDAHVAGPARQSGVSSGGRTFLDVRGLTGPRLSGITLAARAGEVLGVYGLVGSGRTRFLRSLFGAEPVTGGQILIDGRQYAPRSAADALTAGIAFLTEERKRDGFIPLMSAYGNVVLSTLKRYRMMGLIDHAGATKSARHTLARIGTRGRLDAPIKSLSGGNQQKVLFGRIIEQDARLILLDEPTKGVDIGAKKDIYEIIRLLADEGRCVVMVSSEEEELLEVADRITVFHHGRCEYAPVPVGDVTLAALRQAAWTASA
jgi:ABC-type sugar transport system ATPase subunit